MCSLTEELQFLFLFVLIGSTWSFEIVCENAATLKPHESRKTPGRPTSRKVNIELVMSSRKPTYQLPVLPLPFLAVTQPKHTPLTKTIHTLNMSRSILNVILLLVSIALTSALSLDMVTTNVTAGSDFTLHVHNDLSYGSASFDRYYEAYTVYLRLYPLSYEDNIQLSCSLVSVPANTTSVSQALISAASP